MEQFSQLTTLSMVSTTRVKSFEFWVFRFRDLGVFVFEFWVLRFRDLGASFSSFGCFVFEIWVLRASVFVFECFVFETTYFGGSYERNCVSMFEPREIFLFIFK